jgi:hypothetical protein
MLDIPLFNFVGKRELKFKISFFTLFPAQPERGSPSAKGGPAG